MRYTAGELAKKLGVSARTVRFYDEKNCFSHVIELTRDREEVISQYKDDENLKKRISIHDYSTADTEWFHWLFEKEQIKAGMKILDIGCGNATLWKRVAALLPEDLEIHLVDYSDGMLSKAREAAKEIQEQYPEKNLTFVIEKRDATDFSYPTSGFDLIMANHMLYHVAKESRLQLYDKIRGLLKKEGRFTCTLIGQQHMRELHDFVNEFYPSVKFPSAGFDIWLETASKELENFFNVLSVEEHRNDLYVPDEELIFNYVASYSAEAKELVNRDKETFYKRVQSKMNEDGLMYIHKSTGVIICEV